MKIEFEAYELRGIVEALTPPAPEPDLRAFARALTQELPDKRIVCIKLFRAATGWGLREAKDMIEEAMEPDRWTP